MTISELKGVSLRIIANKGVMNDPGKSYNRSNSTIRLCIMAFDLVALWVILYLVTGAVPGIRNWNEVKERVFWMICTTAMLFAEWQFSTIIHRRQVGADEIIKRVTMLTLTFTLATYVMLRAIQFMTRVGIYLIEIGVYLLIVLLILRFIERWILKHFRSIGHNTRHVTLVGNGPELQNIYNRLISNPTLGYRLKKCYGNIPSVATEGSVDDFKTLIEGSADINLGHELYLSVPLSERSLIEKVSKLCMQHMVKFYYVPQASESLNLKAVFMDNIEVLTNYSSPLEDPFNSALKRAFDILLSLLFLLPTLLLLPLVWAIIKWQSPGPLFFRQQRTGLDGNNFWCYKFRSMHVNADSDRLQATLDDPRKFPFGNFMRKTNIDELPQFWNVLCGNMSIVGPRPHMLAHTEQYSQLIDKYMMRHFVKPGVTGWAQVTGFRGETRELWQMEGRVERDIWYIQNWSIWLDIRIIWMTVKTIFVRDKNAY